MVRKNIVFSIFLILLGTPGVLANMGGAPAIPCDEVNPEHYKSLVYNSDVLPYFQDWELINITVPCYCQYGNGITWILVQFDVPQSYSPNNLTYSAVIDFHFKNDTLIYADELLQFHENFISHIESSENNPKIEFFIVTTGITRIETIDTQLRSQYYTLDSSQNEHLRYNFTNDSIESFCFLNPKLIENLDLFISNVSEIPQVEEFKKNDGITYVHFEDNMLSLANDYNLLTYDIDQRSPISYSLENKYQWETFPEISKAHNSIRDTLLIGELSNCTIGTGRDNYTSKHNYITSKDSLMFIDLICYGVADDEIWKSAIIYLKPDGTYKRLEIVDNYPTPNRNCISYIIIPIFIIFILTVLYKTNLNTVKYYFSKSHIFLKPTKGKVITAMLIGIIQLHLFISLYSYKINTNGLLGFIAITLVIISYPPYVILEPIGDILAPYDLLHEILYPLLLLVIPYIYVYILICVFVWVIDKLRKK